MFVLSFEIRLFSRISKTCYIMHYLWLFLRCVYFVILLKLCFIVKKFDHEKLINIVYNLWFPGFNFNL